MTTLITAAKETIDNKDCKPDFESPALFAKTWFGGGANSRKPTNLVPILVI